MPLTAAQLIALPETANGLGRWLDENRPGSADARDWEVSTLIKLVVDIPTPPKVRAAALKRLAANIPGFAPIAIVTDATGRPGTAAG